MALVRSRLSIGLFSVLLTICAGIASGVEVPDPSIMLPLVPDAATTGAPPCIKPGTRLTFYGMTASIPGEYNQMVQDENGNWVDKSTGKRYSTESIPSAASAAYNVVQVGYIGNGIAQLSSRLYLHDTSLGKCIYSAADGLVGHAGCAADYWIHPDVLKKVQQVNAQGVKILRMPYKLGNKTYNAIRFQSEDNSGYHARVYDLETGLLIYYGSRVQGKPVYTPPVGGYGTPGVGQGSTQLVSGWIVDIKDIDVPWKLASSPDWVGQFKQLSYSGVQTTVVAAAGSRLDRPMTLTLTPTARGKDWVRFKNHFVIQSIQGMPPEQADQNGTSGIATIGGLWIAPEALAKLRPMQVIESNELVGTNIAVSAVGQGFVTLTETGPLHKIDCSYDTQTGIMSAMTVTQQIGMAMMTHNIRLAGQQ